jgi:hypothetical protein
LRDVKNYKTKIDGAFNEFKQTLNASNERRIAADMNTFLNGKQNYDFEILDILSRNEHGENSPLKNFIDLTKKMNGKTNNQLQFSVASYVYHFQIEILYSAMKYVTVLELATAIRNHYQRTSTNPGYWKIRRNGLMEQFKKSLVQASKYVSDDESISSLLTLNRTDIVSYQFKVLFQNYIINEFDANGGEGCSQNCNYSVNREISDDHCRGKIGDCYLDPGFGWLTKRKTLKKSSFDYVAYYPGDKRIYFWYKRFDEKQGIELDDDHEETRLMDYIMYAWFTECNHCTCLCDQTASPATVRKIYGGSMRAPSGR